jgi:hypothetical protein
MASPMIVDLGGLPSATRRESRIRQIASAMAAVRHIAELIVNQMRWVANTNVKPC